MRPEALLFFDCTSSIMPITNALFVGKTALAFTRDIADAAGFSPLKGVANILLKIIEVIDVSRNLALDA